MCLAYFEEGSDKFHQLNHNRAEFGSGMNITGALTEPLVRLIAFHNACNRNIKVSFGALEMLSRARASAGAVATALPTGSEPWGSQTRWRNLEQPVKDASSFLAEAGLARATAAFEDYATGAKAEFDRAGLTEIRPKHDGTSAFFGFDATVGIEAKSIKSLVKMANYFDVARNCIVHRSNRASRQRIELGADPDLAITLSKGPNRNAKWTLSLPVVSEGVVIEWQPRHAIMASDVYYRCATMLDHTLVQLMGARGLTRMAAHWCFLADPPAPSSAKLSAEVMVRAQLTSRYGVRELASVQTIALLRDIGMWDDVRALFDRRYPNGPETSLPARRRARASASPARR